MRPASELAYARYVRRGSIYISSSIPVLTLNSKYHLESYPSSRMTRPKKPESCRTIIVGGSITGLTLANALQHAGVDFLVLESRSEIAPQVGASLGLAPNGSRILDQLSCYEEIEKLAELVQSVGFHAANGNDLCPRSDSFQLFHAR